MKIKSQYSAFTIVGIIKIIRKEFDDRFDLLEYYHGTPAILINNELILKDKEIC